MAEISVLHAFLQESIVSGNSNFCKLFNVMILVNRLLSIAFYILTFSENKT